MTRWKQVGTVLGVLVVLVSLASLMPLAEQGHPDANIKTFGDSIWFAMVTLTTVGYGDYYPHSALGKLLGSVFVLGSLGAFSLIIGQVSDSIHHWRERRRLGHHGYGGSDHIVVLGYNALVRETIPDLLESERDVVVVTSDLSEIDQIHERFPGDEVFVLHATYTDPELMRHARLESCFRILLALDEDTNALVTLLDLKRRHPELPTIVAVQNASLVDTFRGGGADRVIATDEVTATLVAGLIFEPDVAEFARDLITANEEEEDHELIEEGYDIQQYRIEPGHRFAGSSWGEAYRYMFEEYRVVPVALARHGSRRRELVNLPDDDEPIEAGDYLLIVTPDALEDHFEGEFFGVRHGFND